jgi:hypothetical protein
MERRNFFRFLSGLAVVPGLSKAMSNQDNSETIFSRKSVSQSETFQNKDNIVSIKPGSIYFLPEQPKYFELVLFKLDGDLQSNPTQIKSKNYNLIGHQEPLLVDCNTDFALRFLGDQTGWVYVSLKS